MDRESFWEGCTVGDICQLITKKPSVVSLETTMFDVISTFFDDMRLRHVYVLDRHNVLQGMMRMRDMLRYFFPGVSIQEIGFDPAWAFRMNLLTNTIGTLGMEEPKKRQVADIMDAEPRAITRGMELREAARMMIRDDVNELPVVDDMFRLEAELSVYEILHYFRENNQRN